MTYHNLTWLRVVLVPLAVYRVSMLVTRDAVPFGRLRIWLAQNYQGSLVELIHCPWCISIWIGAAFVPLAVWCWFWFSWVCLWLVASGVTGFLAEHS